MTDAGRDARHDIERRTDELALRPWLALGEDKTERLAELAAPLAQPIVDGGEFPVPNPIGTPTS